MEKIDVLTLPIEIKLAYQTSFHECLLDSGLKPKVNEVTYPLHQRLHGRSGIVILRYQARFKAPRSILPDAGIVRKITLENRAARKGNRFKWNKQSNVIRK